MERKSIHAGQLTQRSTVMKTWGIVVGLLISLFCPSYMVRHPGAVNQTLAKVFPHDGAGHPIEIPGRWAQRLLDAGSLGPRVTRRERGGPARSVLPVAHSWPMTGRNWGLPRTRVCMRARWLRTFRLPNLRGGRFSIQRFLNPVSLGVWRDRRPALSRGVKQSLSYLTWQ